MKINVEGTNKNNHFDFSLKRLIQQMMPAPVIVHHIVSKNTYGREKLLVKYSVNTTI